MVLPGNAGKFAGTGCSDQQLSSPLVHLYFQELGHRILPVALTMQTITWFLLLLSLVVGTPWNASLQTDMLSQMDDEIWNPQPGHLCLWVWPLGQNHKLRTRTDLADKETPLYRSRSYSGPYQTWYIGWFLGSWLFRDFSFLWIANTAAESEDLHTYNVNEAAFIAHHSTLDGIFLGSHRLVAFQPFWKGQGALVLDWSCWSTLRTLLMQNSDILLVISSANWIE